MNVTETESSKSDSVRSRRLLKAGKIVCRRIEGLGRGFLKGEPKAREALAKLRRGIKADPGEIADIWGYTHVVGVPDNAPDTPTREEWAVYIAMTLYAVHQQSRSVLMHRPGYGFGRAARELVGGEEDSPARCRFNALVTASSIGELRSHLRSFIQLLRPKDIGFDYAAFADDLIEFQYLGGDKKVRRRWSRDFYKFQESGGREAAFPDARASTSANPSNSE